jgi:hypothetical protein
LILDIPAPFPLTAGELRDLAYAAYMDREREYFDELELIGLKQGFVVTAEDYVLRVSGSQVYLDNWYAMDRLLRTWRLFARKDPGLDLSNRKYQTSVCF